MVRIVDFGTLILKTLFPDYCIGCSQINTLICNQCRARIPQAKPTEHSFIHSVFDYRSPVIKEAIWRLKYKNTRRIASVFGEPLYEKILEVVSENLIASEYEKILLIDVPLHTQRFRERGYNQSELLVRAVCAHDTHTIFEYVPNVLMRTRKTKPQARFEKRAIRLNNLKNAFECTQPSLVHGRIVILIDDVTTTGATLDEARRTLARAKPRAIIAITVAH